MKDKKDNLRSSLSPALLSLVADLAPVHVLAHVAALRVEHIEAFVDGHILTTGLLSVNTDLESIVKSLRSLSSHSPL